MTNCPDHLIYVSDSDPGITRKKWGRGFSFIDKNGKRVTSKIIKNRITSLVIPPAWTDVWICQNKHGHIQCTGYDARDRKQYIYHDDWVAYRQKSKFARLGEFGDQLGLIRKQIDRDLKKKQWTRPKVLALIVYLMDMHYFRVGNRTYTEENGSYGVTTLRRKHLNDLSQSEIEITFDGKSGQERRILVRDKKAVRLLRRVSELPGYEIFRYTDKDGNIRIVESGDVNEYLFQITGERFTAKDFRTWGGTKLAIEMYDQVREVLEHSPQRSFEPTLIGLIAEELGNTVSVCREFYVHPRVLETLRKHFPADLNELMRKFQVAPGRKGAEERLLRRIIH